MDAVRAAVKPELSVARPGQAAGGPKWQATTEGADGMISWRSDLKEMYYVKAGGPTGDGLVMAMEIATAPSFQAGTPKV